jgi:hypothetical protein
LPSYLVFLLDERMLSVAGRGKRHISTNVRFSSKKAAAR